MQVTLHVVYRAAPGSNRKARPAYFSKSLCLASLLRAAAEAGDVRLSFLCDGALPDEITATMETVGEIVNLGGVGNARSYVAGVRWAVENVRATGGASFVYLCEDDYLHLPSALEALREVADQLPVGSYATLYDHPDRYRRNDDLHRRGGPLVKIEAPEWRPVESTTMTYGAHDVTLLEDMLLHRLAAIRGYPRDRLLWRTLQGLGARWPVPLIRRRHRILYGVRPSLATHMETGALSAGADWSIVAHLTGIWAASNDMTVLSEW